MADRVFIIAEAGVNHDGSLDDALAMIDVAAEAGADAVKFQTFRAEAALTARALKADYQVTNTGEGGTQLDMVRRLELKPEDHPPLVERCQARGIAFMSTAFDMDSLALVAGFDMPWIKIPSGDLTWGEMLIAAARVGPPLAVSTGMATLDEVRQALALIAWGRMRSDLPPDLDSAVAAFDTDTARAALEGQVVLLHCTTQYPAPVHAVNLRAMDTLAATFGLPVGYSDHSLGVTVPVAAVARGAVMIEKHFTLSRNRQGPDHAASLEPDELTAMVRAIRDVEQALGRPEKAPAPEEMANRIVARRSLVAARAIHRGELFHPDMLTAKRPADGLSPHAALALYGQVATRDYQPDEAIEP